MRGKGPHDLESVYCRDTKISPPPLSQLGTTTACSKLGLCQLAMDHFLRAPLSALVGLRVLSNAAILTVHAMLFVALTAGNPDWYKVLETQWLARAALSTPLLIALNVFFAMTSVLALSHLVPKLQACQTTQQAQRVICLYWWRRYIRLAPALYIMLALHASLWLWEAAGLSHNNAEAHEVAIGMFYEHHLLKWLPAQFVFLGNLTGYSSFKLVPWTWNLMVQAAFYLLFPPLLVLLRPKASGFRRRLVIVAGVMYAAAVVQRVRAVALGDVRGPMTLLAFSNRGRSAGHSALAVRTYNNFTSQIWMSAIGRMSDLASGLLVYLCLSHPLKQQYTARYKLGLQGAAGLAVLFLLATVSFPVVPQAPEPDPGMSLIMQLTSLLAPLLLIAPFVVVALMLYVMLQPDGMSRSAAQLLSSQAWQPFSDRSYSIYLFHVDVGVLLFKFAPWIHLLGGFYSRWPLVVLPVALYLASFVTAVGVDAVVAFALRRLLRNHGGSAEKQKKV